MYKSQMLPIKCGVPQGSLLGPLVYVYDIFSWSKHLSSILNIFFQHKNICDLAESVNRELSLAVSWVKANKLTLHPDNTKFTSFHPPRKKINLDNISISIYGNKTKRVECTQFLGVIIPENLSWQAHIKVISAKVAKSTGIIIKSRQFFLTNTPLTLYSSLVLPYLQCCCIISEADPGFFLGGGALVSFSTSTPVNYTVFFFCIIPVVLENRRSSRGGGGGCAPPAPSP